MKKILINSNPWQTRIALTREDSLQNIYFWSPLSDNLERSFFKGVVVKVLPGIQTAFVEIGQARAGFLHISEIDRELAIQRMTATNQLEEDEIEDVENLEKVEQPKRERDISKILKEGEPILVQVSKEPVYEKGAKLTTCFTLPGRFLVLMPNIPRIGISKKIEDREQRQRLRAIVTSALPEGMGAIIRTASDKHSETEIKQDLAYLVRTWEMINKKFSEAPVKAKIYEDLELPLQVVRDNLDDDVDVVVCDEKEMHTKVYKFIKNIAPEHANKVALYKGAPDLFEKFDIEKQIEEALEKKVFLKSGGSLIIETTEAMTVIDVNTGRYTGSDSNLEETILKTNLEAAEEVVRQLRLRNIGGLIVIDFIDMATGANRQRLYRHLEKTLKEEDKFQSVVLKVSEFGLVQMTRKRSGKTLLQQMTDDCPVCHGLGSIKSIQTESYAILRSLKHKLEQKKITGTATLEVHPDAFQYLTKHEYNAILILEKSFNCNLIIVSNEAFGNVGTYTISQGT
jgi:ribonuclease G